MSVPIPCDVSAATFWQTSVTEMPTTAIATSTNPWRTTESMSRAPTPLSIMLATTSGVIRSKHASTSLARGPMMKYRRYAPEKRLNRFSIKRLAAHWNSRTHQ